MRAIDGKRTILGKYVLLKEIGKGGFATVYLAYDLRLDKFWAVKVVRDLADTLQEARIMKNLEYRTLPRIVDVLRENGEVFLVMDYIQGSTLGALARDGYEFSKEELLDIALELAATLEYLHTCHPPVLYKDLKPDNVILTKEGTIRLLDFGIASYLTEEDAGVSDHRGTRGYAAPEQYAGSCDERTDIFGLGRTLLILSDGKAAGGLAKIIDKCIRKRPADRFSCAARLRQRLQKLKSEKHESGRYRKILIAAGAVLLLLFLLHGIYQRAVVRRYYGILQEAAKTEEDRADTGGSDSGADASEKDQSFADDTVLAKLEEAAALQPNREEAYEMILAVYEKKLQSETGIAHIERLFAANDVRSDEFYSLNKKIAFLYLGGGGLEETFPPNYEKAGAYFAAADGKQEVYVEDLRMLCVQLCKYSTDIRWDLVGTYTDALNKQAEVLVRNGAYADAYLIYRVCGNLSADFTFSLEEKEEAYEQSIRYYEAAYEVCRSYMQDAYYEADVLERLSITLYLQGTQDDADEREESLQRSITYGNQVLLYTTDEALTKRILLRETTIYKLLGKIEEAAGRYEAFLSRYPEDLQALCGYASVLILQGEYEKAKQTLEAASRLEASKTDYNYEKIKRRLEELYEV